MAYIPDNSEFDGRNAQFSGGAPRVQEIALRGNGYVLAVSGGIAVCLGAVLPFVSSAQAAVDGMPVASGGINAGTRFISFLFGVLLAGLAYWTHRDPAKRRGIALAALVTSALGFLGYLIFTIIGVAGVTISSDLGPERVSWDPSIGLLLSLAGCAACAIAAIAMRRTAPQG